MNDEQKARLLNVARALRESPAPDRFTMRSYYHACGTPACALGHYAIRQDLQGLMVMHDLWLVCAEDRYDIVDYDGEELLIHFGITKSEARELFSAYGCGNAQTAIEAAEYIERFVARKAPDHGR